MLTIALSGLGGAVAGCHPTGYAVPDVLWSAAFAAGLTAFGSLANRRLLLIAAAATVTLARGAVLAPALAGVVTAFGAAVPRRPSRLLGGLASAMTVQAALRWSPIGFFGSTTVAAAVLATVLVAGAWPQMSRQTRWTIWRWTGAAYAGAVLLCAPAIVGAILAHAPATAAEAQAKSALRSVEDDQAPQAVGLLRAASANFETANRRANGWWTWASVLVPGVAQQHHAVVKLSGAGRALTSAASGEAGRIDLRHLRGRGGAVDLGALEALSAPVDALDKQIDAAVSTAKSSASGWLVPEISSPLARLDGQLQTASQSVHLAATALQDVPSLLGSNQPRHYLVVFMTPAETRGLGGFLGAFAELSAVDGRIKVVRTGLPKDLVAGQGSPALTGPADYLERYGAFAPQDHLEDTSYSPDFPTVAQVLAQLYPQVGGIKVDGVIALDPYALADMIGFTGPISVSGLPQPLTSANAADELIRTQYLVDLNGGQEGRHDVLSEALSTGFSRLMEVPLPSPHAIGAALGPAVKEGRLLLWTADQRYQPLVRDLGLSGQFPSVDPSSGGVFGLTFANAANNKLDAYLHVSVDSTTDYRPDTGEVDMDVDVTLHNRGTAALPQYVAGSYYRSGIPPGTNVNWISVYNSWPLVSASEDGRPLALSAAQAELGTSAYSGVIRIGPQSSTTLHLVFKGTKAPGGSLSETIRLQPLANPTMFRMSATAASGWRAAPGSNSQWTASDDEVQTNHWKFTKEK